MAVHPGGAQNQASGNTGATVLYAPDGVTPLKTTVDSGAGKALAVQLWDSLQNDYVKIDGAGRLVVTPNPGNAANNPLYIQGALQPSTFQRQAVTHAANTIVLPAAGAGLRNILTSLDMQVFGTGTAPTQAAPLIITVSDGATVIFEWRLAAFTNVPLSAPGSGGMAGTANTSMTISCGDPGANNTTIFNIGYQVG